MVTQKADDRLNIDGLKTLLESSVMGPKQPAANLRAMLCVCSKFYGQAERAISNGKLNALLRFHIRPIKQVVFLCPSKLSLGRSHLKEGFTLICIQRLS
jgi:hypothetical protein